MIKFVHDNNNNDNDNDNNDNNDFDGIVKLYTDLSSFLVNLILN